MERPELFDRVSKLTAIGKFSAEQLKGTVDLFSIQDLLVLRISKDELQLVVDGKVVELLEEGPDNETKKVKISIKAKQWYRFFLTADEKEFSLRLGGKNYLVRSKLPKFDQGKKKQVTIGSSDGGNKNHFIGKLDNVGFYWRVLKNDEISSLLDR